VTRPGAEPGPVARERHDHARTRVERRGDRRRVDLERHQHVAGRLAGAQGSVPRQERLALAVAGDGDDPHRRLKPQGGEVDSRLDTARADRDLEARRLVAARRRPR
jgi:hypothetical protein